MKKLLCFFVLLIPFFSLNAENINFSGNYESNNKGTSKNKLFANISYYESILNTELPEQDAPISLNKSASTVAAAMTYVTDDNFEQALIDLGYDTGPLNDYVPTDNINGIPSLNIPNRNIPDLTGIEDFSSLERLYCIRNQLISLDVSQNTALNYLNCIGNRYGLDNNI